MSTVNINTHYYRSSVLSRFCGIIYNVELIHPESHTLFFTLHTHTPLSLTTYKAWSYFPSRYPQSGQLAWEAVTGNPQTMGETGHSKSGVKSLI